MLHLVAFVGHRFIFSFQIKLPCGDVLGRPMFLSLGISLKEFTVSVLSLEAVLLNHAAHQNHRGAFENSHSRAVP